MIEFSIKEKTPAKIKASTLDKLEAIYQKLDLFLVGQQRQGDKIHALGKSEAQVLQILLRRRSETKDEVGEICAFVGVQASPMKDPALQASSSVTLDFQLQQPIVQEYPGSFRNVLQ